MNLLLILAVVVVLLALIGALKVTLWSLVLILAAIALLAYIAR